MTRQENKFRMAELKFERILKENKELKSKLFQVENERNELKKSFGRSINLNESLLVFLNKANQVNAQRTINELKQVIN